MLLLVLAVPVLFLLAALLWWWARGGVIPAIMLSLAAFPVCALGMVVLHDRPTSADQVNALLCFLVLLALAWTPRLMRRVMRAA